MHQMPDPYSTTIEDKAAAVVQSEATTPVSSTTKSSSSSSSQKQTREHRNNQKSTTPSITGSVTTTMMDSLLSSSFSSCSTTMSVRLSSSSHSSTPQHQQDQHAELHHHQHHVPAVKTPPPAAKTIRAYINYHRTKRDLQHLEQSSSLDNLALMHAKFMAEVNEVCDAIDTEEELKRMFNCRYAGQNVRQGASIESLCRALIHTTRLYNNIISSEYTEFGVGVALGSNGVWYMCQFFRSPPGLHQLSSSFQDVKQSSSSYLSSSQIQHLYGDDSLRLS